MSNTIETDRVVQAMLALLREGYEGGETSWFISHNVPDASILACLENLTADQASAAPPHGGRTIAAHAEHLRWALAFANTFFRGEQPDFDWSKSWTVARVDDQQWRSLLAELRREYETLAHAIEQRADWSDDAMLRGTMAQVAHSAYHLGAIRQLMRWVK